MSKDVNFKINLQIDGKDKVVQASTSVKELGKAVRDTKAEAERGFNLTSFTNLTVSLKNVADIAAQFHSQLNGLYTEYQAAISAETKLATVMKQRMGASEQDVQSILRLTARTTTQHRNRHRGQIPNPTHILRRKIRHTRRRTHQPIPTRCKKHTKTFFRLSPEDYAGLHRRYAQILQTDKRFQAAANNPNNSLSQKDTEKLTKLFDNMMRTLHKEKGATLRIEILTEPSVQNFITTHADTLDNAFKTVPMSDAMRRRLQRSDYIFSGIKTFHEINEAFPSLLNTDGTRKPFTQFLEEVKHIDKTYNQHYLAAEFNFAQASAAMAAKWEQYAQDGERYLLQYRTAGDDRVRPEHASLEGVTLPITDTFWEEFYPPNGWNCRCTVTQVLKSQATPTPHEQAIALGEDALKLDKHRFFRHNSGITGKTFPDYNPYTIQRCRDCDIAKGKLKLGKPSNEVCEACQMVHKCSLNQEETIKHGKGEIHINSMVNRKDQDFHELLNTAKSFSEEGAIVKLTPKMSRPPKFNYQCVYKDLIGTKFEGKCPDLNINGKWFEYEGFTSSNPKNAFRNMLNHGLKQSNRLIIKKPELSESYMRRLIQNRIREGQDINEIWTFDGQKVTLLYKKSED